MLRAQVFYLWFPKTQHRLWAGSLVTSSSALPRPLALAAMLGVAKGCRLPDSLPPLCLAQICCFVLWRLSTERESDLLKVMWVGSSI